MLFTGGCRSFAVPAAARALRISLNKHLNKHALSWRCWSSHYSNTALAGETASSTIDAGSLTSTSSSNRYLHCSHEIGTLFPLPTLFLLDTETCFSLSYPKYDRLLQCPSHKSPPRIEHLVVSQGGSVLEYICEALDLPPL